MAKLRCESETKRNINSKWRRRRAVCTCAVKLIHFLWKNQLTANITGALTSWAAAAPTWHFRKRNYFFFLCWRNKKQSDLFIWICTNAYLRLTNATVSSPPPANCAPHVHRRHILFFDVKFDCLTNWFQFFVFQYFFLSLWFVRESLSFNLNWIETFIFFIVGFELHCFEKTTVETSERLK